MPQLRTIDDHASRTRPRSLSRRHAHRQPRRHHAARARRAASGADRIACEDTRQTQKLLNHFQIDTPTISCHEHNERAGPQELIASTQSRRPHRPCFRRRHARHQRPRRLAGGGSHRRRRSRIPIPGANAALSALVASGLPEPNFTSSDFCRRKPARAARASKILRPKPREFARTLIFYEAPHRILDTLADLEAVWGRRCACCSARTDQVARRIPARNRCGGAPRTCRPRSHPRRIHAARRSACASRSPTFKAISERRNRSPSESRACSPKPASTRKKRSNASPAIWANRKPSSTASCSANARDAVAA